MPFNGSGTYTPPSSSFPAVANTVVSSSKFNAVINDIASALSLCFLRDGSVTLSGALTATGAGSFGGSLSATGGFTGNAATATAMSSPITSSRVKGFTAYRNASTTTSLDMAADEVILINSSGQTVRVTTTGTITNSTSTAGSTANGRDQAGGFAASVYIHFYWIWNGTTLATLSSLSLTAPTLPSGYTYWCYACSVPYTAGSILANMNYSGSFGYYPYTVNAATADGAWHSNSLAGVIPPNSRKVALGFDVLGTGTNATNSANWLIRSTDTQVVSNVIAYSVPNAVSSIMAMNFMPLVLGSSQSFDYNYGLSAITSGGGNLLLNGFWIPNGDS